MSDENTPNQIVSVDPWGLDGLPCDVGIPERNRLVRVLGFEGGTDGYFLSRDYQICVSPDNRYWILWESIEDEEATSSCCVTYEAVASAPLQMGEQNEAAKILLRALWQEHSKGRDAPNCMDSFEADGILNREEITSILAEVWTSCPLVTSDTA